VLLLFLKTLTSARRLVIWAGTTHSERTA